MDDSPTPPLHADATNGTSEEAWQRAQQAQLDILLSAHVDRAAWTDEANYDLIMSFCNDPRLWTKIITRAEELKLPAYLYERAARGLRDAVHAPGESLEALDPSLSPEAQLQCLYQSRSVGLWYSQLPLLASIRHQPDIWGMTKGTADRNHVNPYDLQKAVDAYIDHHRQTHPSATPPLSLAIQGRQEGLATLSTEWGIVIVECLRHGLENATWHLRLDTGQEIAIGSSKNLLSETDTRVAIFDATGKAIRYYGTKEQDRWRELCELIAAIAEKIDTPELSRKGYLLGLLSQYLDYQKCSLTRDTSDEVWEVLALGKKSFVRGGHLYVNAPHFHQFCHPLVPDLTRANLLDLLRHVGGESIKVNCWQSTPRTSRSYWRFAPEMLQEAEPRLEMPLTPSDADAFSSDVVPHDASSEDTQMADSSLHDAENTTELLLHNSNGINEL